MPKQYIETVTKCEDCPNILRIPAISPDVINEMRCRYSRYRKNVYRLIHGDRVNPIPDWCELDDTEILNLPY